MISLADLFLSLLYILGGSIWLFTDSYPQGDPLLMVNQSLSTNGFCLYISFFTAVRKKSIVILNPCIYDNCCSYMLVM